jgi:serine/threonine protein kinase
LNATGGKSAIMGAPGKQWEGRVFDGRFPLLRYLGGHGQSAVFLTQYGESELQDAAIRLIPVGKGDAEMLIRWERAAQLSHPHLMRLLQTGTCYAEGVALHYVVMEYGGENLATLLKERQLSPLEVLGMLASILDVLGYLHGQGLVHGNLKPTNIFTVGNRLKISCDGILREDELRPRLGTSSPYDPPEARDRGFSQTGDIWSLGATLVEMLTQSLPIHAGRKQLAILPETLPTAFLEIAHACLQPDPRWRATVSDVVTRLQRISFQTETPPPDGQCPIKPTEAPSRSHYVVTALALVLAVLLAGILILRREPRQTPRFPSGQPKVQDKLDRKRLSPAAKPSAIVKPTKPSA